MAIVDKKGEESDEKEKEYDDKSSEESDISARGYTAQRYDKNNYSLEFTIATSIKLLEESNPQCIHLFYFLGCLPGGVTIQQLKILWNNPEKHLDKLDQMSFLEFGVEKKQLTPKLQEYVEMEIDIASKENHMNVIA